MKRTPLRRKSALRASSRLKPIGPAKAKKTVRYQAYLKSPTWKIKCELALVRAGHSCQECGGMPREGWVRTGQRPPPWKFDSGEGDGRLHTHHKTYARFGGQERPGDLIVLCARCHNHLHSFDWWKRRRPFA